MNALPRWAEVILVPLISLILALLISMLVIVAIGENPFEALSIMAGGALGSTQGIGYTLYYATNFIFTGLAVAVAFHARLFNIGGEGQAMLGGLGVATMMLYLPLPHWTIALVVASLAAGLFGAAWAAIPAYLQARRGSHIVITTIMFNFIASGLLIYVLREVFKPDGSMEPASPKFPDATHLPSFADMAQMLGIEAFTSAPANVTFFVALLACYLIWLLIWHTPLGYEIRSLGKSEPGARYAGIDPVKLTMIAMLISGALAGMMAINNVLGEAERLVLNATEGAGFIGIAVALMGRNHPVGIIIAAILFGMLYQGGAVLAQDTSIPVQMVIVIQALVIMFTGALDNMVRAPLARLFLSRRRKARAAAAVAGE